MDTIILLIGCSVIIASSLLVYFSCDEDDQNTWAVKLVTQFGTAAAFILIVSELVGSTLLLGLGMFVLIATIIAVFGLIYKNFMAWAEK